jgi:hypothetical protein
MRQVKLAFLVLTTSVAVAQEALVISALINNPSFSLIEFTACADINDLTDYGLGQFKGADFEQPDGVAAFGANVPITAGTHLYVVPLVSGTYQLSPTQFYAFFGFTPTFYAPLDDLIFQGNYNLLVVNKATYSYEDSYGVLGVDPTGTLLDYTGGWAARKSRTVPNLHFNVLDWNIHPFAYENNPISNSLASPPIQLGTYKCQTPTPAPSKAPVTPTIKPVPVPIPPPPTPAPITPTLRPTNGPRQNVPEPTPGPGGSNPLKPSPAPVAPVNKPHNPPRPPGTRSPRP